MFVQTHLTLAKITAIAKHFVNKRKRFIPSLEADPFRVGLKSSDRKQKCMISIRNNEYFLTTPVRVSGPDIRRINGHELLPYLASANPTHRLRRFFFFDRVSTFSLLLSILKYKCLIKKVILLPLDFIPVLLVKLPSNLPKVNVTIIDLSGIDIT